jgi:hypothetical protein
MIGACVAIYKVTKGVSRLRQTVIASIEKRFPIGNLGDAGYRKQSSSQKRRECLAPERMLPRSEDLFGCPCVLAAGGQFPN